MNPVESLSHFPTFIPFGFLSSLGLISDCFTPVFPNTYSALSSNGECHDRLTVFIYDYIMPVPIGRIDRHPVALAIIVLYRRLVASNNKVSHRSLTCPKAPLTAPNLSLVMSWADPALKSYINGIPSSLPL